MKTVLLLVVLAGSALAQSTGTQVNPSSQISPVPLTCPLATEYKLSILTPTGPLGILCLQPSSQITCTTAGVCALNSSTSSGTTLTPSGEEILTVTPGASNVNATATLKFTPSASSNLTVWRNGLKLSLGVDYTVSGAGITFTSAPSQPQTADVYSAQYYH